MDKIAFVILTWNSKNVIRPCLDSILRLRDQSYEIILVDNGSSDGTVQIIDEYCKTYPDIIKKVYLEKNYGTTVSRNMGLKEISPDAVFVCILDSDTVINQKAMNELIAALRDNPENAIAGPSMENLDGEQQITAKKIPTAKLKFFKAFPVRSVQKIGEDQERYNFDGNERYYPVGYLISACWMLDRRSLEKMGPLDEKIFYSPEDVEYCVRAWTKGFRVVYCPEAHIIHATQRISKKKLISRHNWEHIKGLLYFFKKYGLFWQADKIICK